MRNKLFRAAGYVLLAGGMLAASTAANAEPPKQPMRSTEIMPFLVAPGKTRVAALINGDGSIVLSKGVASVIHTATGEYCVILNSAISAATAIPVMTFDYNSSPDFDVFIVYAPASSCATNGITVYTYQADAGGHTFADEGFTFVVP